MSRMFVESEYDMDQALSEVIKLVKLGSSSLDVGFDNMHMVRIFLDNLQDQLLENKIDPSEKKFHLNIMVVRENEQT